MEPLQSQTNPLAYQGVGKLMLKYSIPAVISLVVNSLYNVVDQIFIGQVVGYLGNTATSIILPLTCFLMALTFMLGDGAAAYMSLSLGRSQPEKASRGVGNMVTYTVIVGVVLTVVCLLFITPLCKLFGATADSLPYALDYGRVIVLGFPVAAICCSVGASLRADGRPHATMIGLLIGCCTNIVLDALFVMVFHWGVAGAAWATIIGQALNAVYFIWCLFRFKTIELNKKDFVPDRKITGQILSLGASSFITQIAVVVVVTVMNNAFVHFGGQSKYGPDIPLAVVGIVSKVSQLVGGIAMGIASGSQPIMGYNYGAKQYGRVKQTFKWLIISGTAVLAAACVVFQFWPEYIVNLFGQESELYMEFACKNFRIYLMLAFLIPFTTGSAIFFQSVGKPMPAALLSLTRQVICLVPAALLFGALWGVEGLLYAGAFADGSSFLIAVITVCVCWKKIFRNDEA